MRIQFGAVTLADGSVSQAVSGFQIDNAQVVQEINLLRAVKAAFVARKNRKRRLTFTITRNFNTIVDAETHFFAHYPAVADQANLVVTIGMVSEGQQDATFADAVLESLAHSPPVGVSVSSRYSFAVSELTGITPTVEDGGGNATITAGTFAIPNGVNSVTVTSLDLSTPPQQLLVTVRKPAGGLTLFATVVDGSVTADQFVAYLNGQTNSTGYYLDWCVTLPL